MLKYLFLLQYRTVDDLNNGNFGRSYVFNVGEGTSLLEGFFVPDAIESYRQKSGKKLKLKVSLNDLSVKLLDLYNKGVDIGVRNLYASGIINKQSIGVLMNKTGH